MIELVLGGAKSGKTNYAEQQAISSKKQVIYLATAEAGDGEMALKIKKHQQNRPQHWQTVEEPIKLAKIIQQYSEKNTCLLVDCLTLWLTNILFNKQGKIQQTVFERETKALFEVLTSSYMGQIILVSNELGLGVVAANKMTRQFVDEAGLLHQKLATLSDKVVFITAGLPHILK